MFVGGDMEYNCGFTQDNKWFRYRAAAIIVENDCVLFAGNEKEDFDVVVVPDRLIALVPFGRHL